MRRQDRISGFVDALWRWYACQKRILPWRDLSIADDTERAYRILVSEVMLQQTQVERVKVIYERFLRQFPLLSDLALASNRDVILAWRGMGYNSRALRLRDAARWIVGKNAVRSTQHAAQFPRSMEELTIIPGIGHYTAAAIRNFAFNLSTPCIDTNIRRILHRTFVGPERADGTFPKDDAYLLKIAHHVSKAAIDGQKGHDARNWHAALMDFGSLVQTKRNPQWGVCPLTLMGVMKTTPASLLKTHSSKLPDPGRHIAGRFVPDRIVRGRIVEALRDASAGLSLHVLGRRAAADWSPRLHRAWLQRILRKLVADRLIEPHARKFRLAEEAA